MKTYKVVSKCDGYVREETYHWAKQAQRAFRRLSQMFDWVVIISVDMERGSEYTVEATEAVMLGQDPKPPLKRGRDVEHTGFCMSTFNTVKCNDCPTLNECIIMMMKDQTKSLLKQMREDNI